MAAQADDPHSLLTFYRHLLRLRKSTPALSAGEYRLLHAWSEAYLAFLRADAASGQTCLVVLNFSAEAQTAPFDRGGQHLRLLFAHPACPDPVLVPDQLTFAPFAVFVAEVL